MGHKSVYLFFLVAVMPDKVQDGGGGVEGEEGGGVMRREEYKVEGIRGGRGETEGVGEWGRREDVKGETVQRRRGWGRGRGVWREHNEVEIGQQHAEAMPAVVKYKNTTQCKHQSLSAIEVLVHGPID